MPAINITIIGSGSMGNALAQSLSRSGHKIWIGSREPESVQHKYYDNDNVSQVSITSIEIASEKSNVIIIAVPTSGLLDVLSKLPDVSKKIIIETTNAFGTKIPGFANSIDAIKKLARCQNVARCFNTIGAENITDLRFENVQADAFTAGDSNVAKEMASSPGRSRTKQIFCPVCTLRTGSGSTGLFLSMSMTEMLPRVTMMLNTGP